MILYIKYNKLYFSHRPEKTHLTPRYSFNDTATDYLLHGSCAFDLYFEGQGLRF